MATIGKIRKHSTLLLIAVGGAIVLFVLSDFFNRGGRKQTQTIDVAVVDKDKISYREYSHQFEEKVELYKQQQGENIENALLFQIRNEVYDEMIREHLIQREYDKSGVDISEAEMYDLMTGKNIHPIIIQNFTDPQTGQFNPANVQNYIENLDQMKDDEQRQWFYLEKMVKNDRHFTKYENLVKKALFMPKTFAKRHYENQNTIKEGKIMVVRYNSIEDSEVSVTDNDFQNYYNKHKQEYEQENSSHVEYVIFDIKPSEEDKKYAAESIQNIHYNFTEILYDDIRENFLFASQNSDFDFRADTNFIHRFELTAQADTLFDMPLGSVIGPYIDNNVYFIHKLLKRESRPDSLKASHILISYTGAFRADPQLTKTKEEAETLADSLLGVVRNTDSLTFAAIANEFSVDESANKTGGSLGWFEDGLMIKSFNDACINASKGDYFVVETDFGFHIIHLTGKTELKPKVRVATVKYTIEPSSETRQKVYTESSKFAGENRNAEAFEKAVIELGYIKRTAEQTKTTDYSLPGIEQGREIIRWVFDEETKENTVSNVFDFANEYKNVVVLVKEVRPKGIAPLSQIKEQIRPFVIREKKAEIIIQNIHNAMKKASSIEDIARQLNAEVDTIDYINFASPNIPKFGPEHRVVGIAAALDVDEISKPIKGQAGVFVLQITNVNKPQPTEDYTSIIFNQLGFLKNRVSYDLYNALLKKADIKDNRIMFF